jgi:hypothetical protein
MSKLGRGVRRIEHMPVPAVTAVEAARVAPVQTTDGRCEHVAIERRDQVVMRRHETETVARQEALGDKLGDDLDAVVIVAVVAEDVFLRDRAGGDVERSCVRRAHPSSLPAPTAPPATELSAKGVEPDSAQPNQIREFQAAATRTETVPLAVTVKTCECTEPFTVTVLVFLPTRRVTFQWAAVPVHVTL